MKTLLTLLIVVVLAYMALSFVSWDMNPAHWSAIARTVLIIVFILVSLKPLADRLNSTGTREVSTTEFERNRSVYKDARAMNVSGLTPDEIASVRATLAKAQTLLDKLN